MEEIYKYNNWIQTRRNRRGEGLEEGRGGVGIYIYVYIRTIPVT